MKIRSSSLMVSLKASGTLSCVTHNPDESDCPAGESAGSLAQRLSYLLSRHQGPSSMAEHHIRMSPSHLRKLNAQSSNGSYTPPSALSRSPR